MTKTHERSAPLAAPHQAVQRGRVLMAGAGHIGCHLLPLLARTSRVGLIRVVDRGRVGPGHVLSEGYPAETVGQSKADAICERWAPLFPEVTLESIPADLEDVPFGEFDVDVCLGGLDSLRARQVLVSERAFPLGVPVVDGGVGEGLLGRVHVFHPGSACLECRFGPQQYRTLAAEYPCRPDEVYLAPSTTAPAFVGAAVAAVMTAETVRILAGDALPESCEIFFDLASRRFLTSRLMRATRCRFDHEIVHRCLYLNAPPATATVGDLLQAVRDGFGPDSPQLEFRRGVLQDDALFGPQRLATPEWLERHGAQRLAELGLTAQDRIRVVARDRSAGAFVVLDSQSEVTRT